MGNITEKDIEQEARAVDKLCRTTHENIIKIYQHGRFSPESPNYYFDMELCDVTLEEYIYGRKTGVRGLVDWETARKEGQHEFLIIAIMQELLSGLAYIHEQDEVHRDMTPQNGMLPLIYLSNSVLYSAASGWWKIADFGLTSTATSRRLHMTTGQRGKPCYRAPELVRDFGLGVGFSRKVDIWSLGCILFELCVGYKAFNHDFDTYDFATGRKNLEITIHTFDHRAELYEKLIRQMLSPHYESRPSIKEICAGFSDIIKRMDVEWGDGELNEEDFIKPENMLGMAVPSNDGFHCMHWDLGLPGQEHAVGRWEMMEQARTRILGPKHVNTVWTQFCYAWVLVSAGCVRLAVRGFEKLLEQSDRKLWAYYGLIWALTEAGRLGDAHEALINLELDLRKLNSKDDSTHRILLAANSALARSHLLSQFREENVDDLKQLVAQQTTRLGPDHAETLASRALLGVAELLQHNHTATLQSDTLLRACSSETKVFQTERPAILTLCQLAWTLARNSKGSEARRLFDETVRRQREYYGRENVLSETSLENLAQFLRLGPIPWVQENQLRPTSPDPISTPMTAQPSDTLLPNQELKVGQSIVSADGRIQLILQADGNFVLYGPQGHPLWSTGTVRRPSQRVIMQEDGNLVIYDGNNSAVWVSGTGGYPGAKLINQNDGNQVIYGPGGQVLWASNTLVPITPDKPTEGDRLQSNQGLMPGESIVSADMGFKLVLQSDGNLVQYGKNDTALWATNTQGHNDIWAVFMQTDGNLVVRDTHCQPLWASRTNGHPGAMFVVQDDGNLVIYDVHGIAIWNSGPK